jgi:hypothetical protein
MPNRVLVIRALLATLILIALFFARGRATRRHRAIQLDVLKESRH